MQLAPEVVRLTAMQGCFHEEAHDGSMSHFQESPVRAVDSSANDPKLSAIDLPGQLIILGIERLFIKSAELVESSFVDKHEHPGCEGPVESGKPLCHVVADIEKVVRPTAVPAQNVRRHAMQHPALYHIEGASQESRICEFDVCVDEQKVSAVRAPGSVVAAD